MRPVWIVAGSALLLYSSVMLATGKMWSNRSCSCVPKEEWPKFYWLNVGVLGVFGVGIVVAGFLLEEQDDKDD